MNTIEQAKEVSNRLRTITATSINRNTLLIAAHTLDALIAENEALLAATLRIKNDAKIIEGLTREQVELALDAKRYRWRVESYRKTIKNAITPRRFLNNVRKSDDQAIEGYAV